MKKLIFGMMILIFLVSIVGAVDKNYSIVLEYTGANDFNWKIDNDENRYTNTSPSTYTSSAGTNFARQNVNYDAMFILNNLNTITAQQTSSDSQLSVNNYVAQTITLSSLNDYQHSNISVRVWRSGVIDNARAYITAVNSTNDPDFSLKYYSSASTDVSGITENSAGEWFNFTFSNMEPNGEINIELINPTDNSNLLDSTTQVFNASTQVFNGNITNSTLFVWFLNGTLANQTTNILTGENIVNYTDWNVSLIVGNYVWNVESCMDNSSSNGECAIATSNYSLTVGLSDIGQNSSYEIYETDYTYHNITFNISSGTPTVRFWFNGTSKTTSGTNLYGNTWRFTSDFLVDASPTESLGTKNLIWEIISGSLNYNTTTTTQTLNATNLSSCGASLLNIYFVNFTFINETTNAENTNASIDASLTYWLHTSTTNKTLSYTNTTEWHYYGFCGNPPWRTLNVDGTINYNNDESQQRTYTIQNTAYTNATSNINLYILPNILGVYSSYQTIDSIGDIITSVAVTITRSIGGSVVTIFSGLTDGSGKVTPFLNPDFAYTFTFVRSGFSTVTTSIQPVSGEVTQIIMGGGGIASVGNGTQIATNTSYTIEPSNSTLINNTDYTFSFEVSSSQTITFISMNITNSTGGQIGYAENSGEGTISDVVNTGNLTRIVGRYIIRTSDEEFSVTKVWLVGEDFIGEYSIFRQFSLFTDYEFRDFIRMLLVLGIIGGLMVFLSKNEIIESSDTKIWIAVLFVWAFSIVGWLDTGLIANSTNQGVNDLAQFSSQYGIAILSTGVASFFSIRRLF